MKIMLHKVFYPIIFVCLLLVGCNKFSLPEYWLCSGDSTQRVYDHQLNLLEVFTGKDPLMIEKFGNTIYQFLAPAFSGQYYICSESFASSLINVQFQPCIDKSIIAKHINHPIRYAVFNLNNGEFQIRELRTLNQKIIINDGNFICKSLGNSFSFNDFNRAKD
jgi:hypothetical protein